MSNTRVTTNIEEILVSTGEYSLITQVESGKNTNGFDHTKIKLIREEASRRHFIEINTYDGGRELRELIIALQTVYNETQEALDKQV